MCGRGLITCLISGYKCRQPTAVVNGRHRCRPFLNANMTEQAAERQLLCMYVIDVNLISTHRNKEKQFDYSGMNCPLRSYSSWSVLSLPMLPSLRIMTTAFRTLNFLLCL